MYLAGIPISSGYGNRPTIGDFHHGVDFACASGTKLPALVSGTIAFEGYINAAVVGYSKELIIILQADGYFIVYGHLSQTLVNSGQKVNQGDIIALSGNSGYTFGAHLHIERRRGTKSASQGLSSYPSEDITPLLQAYGQAQGGANDMDIRRALQDLNMVAHGKPMPKYVEDEKYNYIVEGGSWAQLYRDLFEFSPSYLSQLRALEQYQQAREASGAVYPGGATQFAVDRINGGDNFQKVITRDMAYYLDQERQLTEARKNPQVPQPSAEDIINQSIGKKLRELLKEANG